MRRKISFQLILFHFFNLQNCFMDLPGDVSMESPDMRLQGFINFSRAGVPVSVDVTLERPVIVLTQEGIKKNCGSDSSGLIIGTWPQAVVDPHHPTI